MTRRQAPALLISLVIGAATPNPSAFQEPTLEVSGGRIGDPITVRICGTAFDAGLVGFDVGGGPTSTLIGQVSLDLSPQLFVLPVTLDAAGWGEVVLGTQPNPVLAGKTVHCQAALADGMAHSGVTLSNGDSVELFPPLLYVLEPGQFGTSPSPPTTLVYYDPLTGSAAKTIEVPWAAHDLVHLPWARCVVVTGDFGQTRCYDDRDGELRHEFRLLTEPTHLAATGYEDVALGLFPGEEPHPLFGGGTAARLEVFSPRDATKKVLPLDPAHPWAMFPVQGTTTVCLIYDNQVLLVDWREFTISTIRLDPANGNINDAVLVDDVLVAMQHGRVLWRIDTNSGAIVAGPVQVPLQTWKGVTKIRAGPAYGTDAVAVLSGHVGAVAFHDAETLTYLGTVQIPKGANLIELSAGATEWLVSIFALFDGTASGRLCRIEVATMELSEVGTFSPDGPNLMTVLPSGQLRRVYISSENDSTLFEFSTDPAQPFAEREFEVDGIQTTDTN